MVSHHTEAADVVQFVHPADVAVGRSRKAASVVILKRLRQLLAETELRPSDWGQIGDAIHGDLHIICSTFTKLACASGSTGPGAALRLCRAISIRAGQASM